MLNNLLADLCLPFVFSWLKGSSLVWTHHLCPTLGRALNARQLPHPLYSECSVTMCHSLFSSFSLLRKKSAKLKTSYKRDFVNMGCDLDFDMAGPTIHAAAVLGYEGWLAGYQLAFDTAKSRQTHNNFAFGYRAGDFQLHTSVWVGLSQAVEARTEGWMGVRTKGTYSLGCNLYCSVIPVMMAQSLVALSIRRWTATWRQRWPWPGQLEATTRALVLEPNTSWIRIPLCL